MEGGTLANSSHPAAGKALACSCQPSFLTKAQLESVSKVRERKSRRIAADIQRVLRNHLSGSALNERVDDHLEKSMRNYDKLMDYGEIMDKFKYSKEARTQLEQGQDLTIATTISQVKGKLNTFQLQNKAALIKKLWWRSVTCKAER